MVITDGDDLERIYKGEFEPIEEGDLDVPVGDELDSSEPELVIVDEDELNFPYGDLVLVEDDDLNVPTEELVMMEEDDVAILDEDDLGIVLRNVDTIFLMRIIRKLLEMMDWEIRMWY